MPPRAARPSVAPATAAEDDSEESKEWEESEESDSESEGFYHNQEALFVEENPQSARHRWLVGFFKYLGTPAAGYHQHQNRYL